MATGDDIAGEGIAYRSVEVDTVDLDGYGFRRKRGGPMCQDDASAADLAKLKPVFQKDGTVNDEAIIPSQRI